MLLLMVLMLSIMFLTFFFSFDMRFYCFLNLKEFYLLLFLEFCDEDVFFYDLIYLELIILLNMEYLYYKKFSMLNSYLYCSILENMMLYFVWFCLFF